jgi:hypothetical protein
VGLAIGTVLCVEQAALTILERVVASASCLPRPYITSVDMVCFGYRHSMKELDVLYTNVIVTHVLTHP